MGLSIRICFFHLTCLTISICAVLTPIFNENTKTFSACRNPLDACPTTNQGKKIRNFCIGSCPPGMTYICGKDRNNSYLSEVCLPIKTCPAGKTNELGLDLKTKVVTLLCVQCDNGHFQPVPSNSSNGILKGCNLERYPGRMKADFLSKRFIRYEEGWPTASDKFHCNHENGWSDKNGKKTCTATDICFCINSVKCLDPNKSDLMPDGQCVEKCEVKREASNNFMCERTEMAVESSHNEVGEVNQRFDNVHNVSEIEVKGKDKEVDSTKSAKEPTPTNPAAGLIDWPIVVVIITVSLFVIVSVVVIILCCKYGSRIFNGQKNQATTIILADKVAVGRHATFINLPNTQENGSLSPGASRSTMSSIETHPEEVPMMEYQPSGLPDNEIPRRPYVTQPSTDAENKEYMRNEGVFNAQHSGDTHLKHMYANDEESGEEQTFLKS